MPAFDFKEIPEAHISSGNQDSFELFTRDFFTEVLSFSLLSEPSRGADGGKDMLFSEVLSGDLSEDAIVWLVSCKHKAHSGLSVTPKDEGNIVDRLVEHGAKGFIGFYSTLPSAGLNDRLESMKNKGYRIQIFNHERIEQLILRKKKYELFKRYFPKSFESWNEDNSKMMPSKLLSKYEPLPCVVCGKDLLKAERYQSIILFEEDNETEIIEDVYCVCKGQCDRYMTHKASLNGHYTTWEDITDFIIPTIYLKKCMSVFNGLHYGRLKFSEKAFNHYKEIVIAISQFALRHQSDDDFRRALDLAEIPDWV